MNEEILKLAKECGFTHLTDGIRNDEPCDYYDCWPDQLEAFYAKAFNAGIEAAAKVATDYIEHGGREFLEEARALEMK